MSNDPIHQFHINPIVPIEVLGVDASFTNASLAMVGGVAAAALFFNWAMKPAALVPGRGQMVAETAYGFVHGMLNDAAGKEGVKRFLPLVFTLFLFVFMSNMLGMFPGIFQVSNIFAPTSQIVITAALALIVFFTVIIAGVAKNGLKFLKLFAPSGVPWYILWFVVLIEIISFFSRPLSHSVRLWANILAGHILLKVFASFVPALIAAGGFFGALSVLPLLMTVALYGLEFLVAFLQAYVFAILTCIYLNDALHPGH